MNRKLLILLFFLVTFFTKAQNVVWTTNVTDAIAQSKEQRKPLLILFTGTGASESIQKEVFNTLEFQNWSRKKVILVKLDLSAETSSDIREQSIKLKNAFNIVDLPEVCFAFANTRNGKTMFQALGKLSYKNEGAKSWISESETILNPSE